MAEYNPDKYRPKPEKSESPKPKMQKEETKDEVVTIEPKLKPKKSKIRPPEDFDMSGDIWLSNSKPKQK